ncbi:hypothetical protein ACP4OV_003501 [Aristida adscensionis]
MPADGVHRRPRKRPKRCPRHLTPPPAPLPLDLVLEIAARTDPGALVRCAATCRDVRRRIAAADGAFRGRLRLRHADRFVPSLLRGHLFTRSLHKDLFLQDYSTTHPTLLLTAAAAAAAAGCSTPPPSPAAGDAPSTTSLRLLDARDGLLLVRTADKLGKEEEEELRVCNPVTGRSQIIPHGRKFLGNYVLLVGDGEGGVLGRPFQVVKTNTTLSRSSRRHRRLLRLQTFSSEHGGAWPLVVGGAAHWLCRSDAAYYVIKLNAGVGAARVTATKLPASFHAAYGSAAAGQRHLLLAAMSPAVASHLCVLVADGEKVSAWVQREPNSSAWKRQTVIENEAMARFSNRTGLQTPAMPGAVRLEWFAERSGTVIIDAPCCGVLELDLRSKEIIRSFSDRWSIMCPYEMDLSSWVPTLLKPFDSFL